MIMMNTPAVMDTVPMAMDADGVIRIRVAPSVRVQAYSTSEGGMFTTTTAKIQGIFGDEP